MDNNDVEMLEQVETVVDAEMVVVFQSYEDYIQNLAEENLSTMEDIDELVERLYYSQEIFKESAIRLTTEDEKVA